MSLLTRVLAICLAIFVWLGPAVVPVSAIAPDETEVLTDTANLSTTVRAGTESVMQTEGITVTRSATVTTMVTRTSRVTIPETTSAATTTKASRVIVATKAQAVGTPTPIPTAPAPPPPRPDYRNAVRGMVINWAYRNEVDFPVSLRGGGWSLETRTDTNALYAFEGLGEGIALVNPILAKNAPFKPLTVDLAVPISAPADRMVNIGIYGGEQVPTGLPMSISLTPSTLRVDPGQMVDLVVHVTNNMPTAVHQVMVTDLFTPELVPLTIQTSVGNAWVGGPFAAAEIGTMEPGQTETVTMTARLADDALVEQAIINRANVIYQESVALQATVTLNGEVLNHLPETGGVHLGLPVSGLVLMLAIIGIRKVRLGASR